MTEEDRLYWVWFAEALGQGNRLASKLISISGGAKAIHAGYFDKLQPCEEFPAELIVKLKKLFLNRSLEAAQSILYKCQAVGAYVVTPLDSDYPVSLRTMPDMPVVLYARGTLPNCSDNLLTTVVGTRTMTDYGRRIAYSLGAGLAFGGSVIVSGMALGADSMALAGALDAGGKTVAVLGSGVDVIYPREHRNLYYNIISKGAVISEYPPGSPPAGRHFPVRNRIMSGISDATVVVEADLKSGSLITARNAVAQGRKLFAVPGKIGENGAEGTNQLICDGALPVVTAEDILSEFEFLYPATVNVQKAHLKLRNLNMDFLSKESMDKERISARDSGHNYYGNGSYGGKLAKNAGYDEKTMIEPSKDDVRSDDFGEKEINEHDRSVNSSLFRSEKKNSNRKNKKQTVNSDKKTVISKKIEFDLLDENEIRLYNKMKPNVPTLPDELVDSEFSIDFIMSALTALELSGAVECGGGGYFMRVSEEDIMLSEND